MPTTDDAVRDFAALGGAYAASALAAPDLYAAMFDTRAELEDPEAAAASFGLLVHAASRAHDAGRLPRAQPGDVATRTWAMGHGLTTLTAAGLLPLDALPTHAVELTVALLVAAGDREDACRASVERGWVEGWGRPA